MEAKDSMEAERKIEHWLRGVNCQLMAAALEHIDDALYQIYKAQGWRVAHKETRCVESLFYIDI